MNTASIALHNNHISCLPVIQRCLLLLWGSGRPICQNEGWLPHGSEESLDQPKVQLRQPGSSLNGSVCAIIQGWLGQYHVHWIGCSRRGHSTDWKLQWMEASVLYLLPPPRCLLRPQHVRRGCRWELPSLPRGTGTRREASTNGEAGSKDGKEEEE